MKFFRYYVIAALVLCSFLPHLVLAQESKVIFSYDFLTSRDYLTQGINWKVSNNTSDAMFHVGDGMLLKNDGNVFLTYPLPFNDQQYDRLTITLMANKPVTVIVLRNIQTKGASSYQLVKKIPASDTYQTLTFSLHVPLFQNTISSLGLNFYSVSPSSVIIKEIDLSKASGIETAWQSVADYFLVSSYLPYTVNLLETPQIFGHAAMLYFLPVVVLLLWLLFFSKTWQRIAAIGLLALWVITDIRMSYEFLVYNLKDYQTYVQPPVAEKALRNYDDFYQFADWVKSYVHSPNTTIAFYNFGSSDFPRILQYEIYPVIVGGENTTTKLIAVYNRPEIRFNSADQRLYMADTAITGPGTVLATFNQNSLIFQAQ